MPDGRSFQPRPPGRQGRAGISVTLDVGTWRRLIPIFQEVLDKFEYGSPERREFLTEIGLLGEEQLRYVYENEPGYDQEFPTMATGLFGSSIIYNIISGPGDSQVRVSIVSRGVPYAEYLEEGGPPQEVPASVILAWMQNKGFTEGEKPLPQVARSIAARIREVGTEPRYLFADAFSEVSPHTREFYDEVGRVAEEYLADLFF